MPKNERFREGPAGLGELADLRFGKQDFEQQINDKSGSLPQLILPKHN